MVQHLAIYIALCRMNSASALLALSVFASTTASAACGAQSVKSPAHELAVKRIEALTEYKSWRSLVSATSNVRPTRLAASDQLVRVGSRCLWSIAIYEDHGSHLYRWQTFLVSQDGKVILVEDLQGIAVPISEWRASQRLTRNAL